VTRRHGVWVPRTESRHPHGRATDAAARGGPRGAPKRVRRTSSEAKLAGARPPREASPAKVASDGQHNDDDDDDPKPGRHVILSSGARRLYDEPTRIRKRVRAYAAMGTARARASAHASRARMRAMHARARVKLLVSRRGSRYAASRWRRSRFALASRLACEARRG
jgi:hypothetical protein